MGVHNLAQAHPHFFLKLLEADEAIRLDFIAHYIDALRGATGSRLYVELKNNQSLNGGSRLYLMPRAEDIAQFNVHAPTRHWARIYLLSSQVVQIISPFLHHLATLAQVSSAIVGSSIGVTNRMSKLMLDVVGTEP